MEGLTKALEEAMERTASPEATEKRIKKPWKEVIKEKCSNQILDTSIVCKVIDGTTKLNIQVWEANVGCLLYWNLETSMLCMDGDDLHPFMHLHEEGSEPFNNTGEKVADNEYSRMLIKWISKTDEELKGHTGKKTPSRYRATLIEQLCALFDP
jgi:hypothetical protein